MSSLLTLAKDLEQQSKAQQKSTDAMLKAAFSAHERSVKAELNASAERINSAISAHDESMKAAIALNTKRVLLTTGRTWLFIVLVSCLLVGTSGGILWWQGQQIADSYSKLSELKETQRILSEKNNGVQLSTCGDNRRRCVKVNPEAGRFGEDSAWMILAEE